MLLALRKIDDTKFLCPYCGALLERDDKNTVIDHIVPRNAWKGFRTTVRYDERVHGVMGRYPCPEGDPKNLIYSCYGCNRSKSDLFIIPNWDKFGMFKLWGMHDLRLHALFFYNWSDIFMEFYNREKFSYPKNSWNRRHCEEVVDNIKAFREEFEYRNKNDIWMFNK